MPLFNEKFKQRYKIVQFMINRIEIVGQSECSVSEDPLFLSFLAPFCQTLDSAFKRVFIYRPIFFAFLHSVFGHSAFFWVKTT